MHILFAGNNKAHTKITNDAILINHTMWSDFYTPRPLTTEKNNNNNSYNFLHNFETQLFIFVSTMKEKWGKGLTCSKLAKSIRQFTENLPLFEFELLL